MIPFLINTVALLATYIPDIFDLDEFPIAYYQLLRWLTCGVAIYGIYKAFKLKNLHKYHGWAFVAVAVVFNPIAPTQMERESWLWVDGLAIIILMITPGRWLFTKLKSPSYTKAYKQWLDKLKRFVIGFLKFVGISALLVGGGYGIFKGYVWYEEQSAEKDYLVGMENSKSLLKQAQVLATNPKWLNTNVQVYLETVSSYSKNNNICFEERWRVNNWSPYALDSISLTIGGVSLTIDGYCHFNSSTVLSSKRIIPTKKSGVYTSSLNWKNYCRIDSVSIALPFDFPFADSTKVASLHSITKFNNYFAKIIKSDSSIYFDTLPVPKKTSPFTSCSFVNDSIIRKGDTFEKYGIPETQSDTLTVSLKYLVVKNNKTGKPINSINSHLVMPIDTFNAWFDSLSSLLLMKDTLRSSFANYLAYKSQQCIHKSQPLCIEGYDYYYIGGAHGMMSRYYYLFDLNTYRTLLYEDIINNEFSSQIKSEISRSLRIYLDIPPTDSLSRKLFADTVSISKTIGINDSCIIFTYQPYEIACFAMGIIDVQIPIKRISPFLNKTFAWLNDNTGSGNIAKLQNESPNIVKGKYDNLSCFCKTIDSMHISKDTIVMICRDSVKDIIVTILNKYDLSDNSYQLLSIDTISEYAISFWDVEFDREFKKQAVIKAYWLRTMQGDVGYQIRYYWYNSINLNRILTIAGGLSGNKPYDSICFVKNNSFASWPLISVVGPNYPNKVYYAFDSINNYYDEYKRK